MTARQHWRECGRRPRRAPTGPGSCRSRRPPRGPGAWPSSTSAPRTTRPAISSVRPSPCWSSSVMGGGSPRPRGSAARTPRSCSGRSAWTGASAACGTTPRSWVPGSRCATAAGWRSCGSRVRRTPGPVPVVTAQEDPEGFIEVGHALLTALLLGRDARDPRDGGFQGMPDTAAALMVACSADALPVHPEEPRSGTGRRSPAGCGCGGTWRDSSPSVRSAATGNGSGGRGAAGGRGRAAAGPLGVGRAAAPGKTTQRTPRMATLTGFAASSMIRPIPIVTAPSAPK